MGFKTFDALVQMNVKRIGALGKMGFGTLEALKGGSKRHQNNWRTDRATGPRNIWGTEANSLSHIFQFFYNEVICLRRQFDYHLVKENNF